MSGSEFHDWVQVVFSGVLAALTAVLAYQAYQSRKATAYPNVVVTADAWKGPSHPKLVIKNVGPGVAYNVKIMPHQDITSDELCPGELKGKQFLQQPIIKPGDVLNFF